MAEVIIVGAGLTGLSVAYHLERHGFFDYAIYEQANRPGGLVRSEVFDGFTYDYTGHFLHVNHPYFQSFLSDVVGFEHFDVIHRKSAIYSHDVLTEYPFQINLHGLPTDVIVDCITGFITRKKTKKEPSNFYQWVLTHFGQGLGEHFFFPYQEKLFSYDIKKIHPSWTGRFVPETDVATILRGALQPPASSIGYNHLFYYPQKGGIEYIIKRIQSQLITPVQTQAEVVNIDTINKKIHCRDGKSDHYQILVNTMPLKKMVSIITGSQESYLKQASQKLICNSVINVNLGFSSPLEYDKHWIYLPEKRYSLYRMGFWHNISKSLVPKSCYSIYGEISFLPEKSSATDRSQKIDQAILDILQLTKLNPQDVVQNTRLMLDSAYVIYDAWFIKNRHALFSHLEQNDILSVGRYGGWKYSSMQEAVLDGKETAEKILAYVHHNTAPRSYTVEKRYQA